MQPRKAAVSALEIHMSVHTPELPSHSPTDLPWYRRERWLAVQLAALVPILGAMLVPATYRLSLCILGGALVAIGTLMLLRHKPAPHPSRHGAESDRA